MPQPLVSVIVPAYNAAGFISRCVESITSQSYPELEILLLNDGSTDDTLAVCRKLAAADSRIRAAYRNVKDHPTFPSPPAARLDFCAGLEYDK